MIPYLLQHYPFLMVLVKTYFPVPPSQSFNTLAAFIQVLFHGRHLSIRDTFVYYHAIVLSRRQNRRTNTSKATA